MRLDLTKSISDLMALKGWTLQHAADYMINNRLVALGGQETGGVIALDARGNIATPFNTSGMYRGWIDPHGRMKIEIYKNE